MKRGIILLLLLLCLNFISAESFDNRSIILDEDSALLGSDSTFSMNYYQYSFEYKGLNTSGDFFEKKVNLCMGFLYSSDGNLKSVEGDFCNRVYRYELTESITYTYNYSILYLFVLIYLIYGIKKYRDKHVLIAKKVMKPLGSELEISSSRFEILIENNTNSTLKNCIVKDIVPSVFEVREGAIGTIKPQVVSRGNSKEINFNLGDLNPGDQFLIYYDIHTRLNLAEDYEPEAAKLIYDTLVSKNKEFLINYKKPQKKLTDI